MWIEHEIWPLGVDQGGVVYRSLLDGVVRRFDARASTCAVVADLGSGRAYDVREGVLLVAEEGVLFSFDRARQRRWIERLDGELELARFLGDGVFVAARRDGGYETSFVTARGETRRIGREAHRLGSTCPPVCTGEHAAWTERVVEGDSTSEHRDLLVYRAGSLAANRTRVGMGDMAVSASPVWLAREPPFEERCVVRREGDDGISLPHASIDTIVVDDRVWFATKAYAFRESGIPSRKLCSTALNGSDLRVHLEREAGQILAPVRMDGLVVATVLHPGGLDEETLDYREGRTEIVVLDMP